MVTPSRSGKAIGYRGWAFCARSKDKRILLCYFEKECPAATIRGLAEDSDYYLTWFNPVDGVWNQAIVRVATSSVGRLVLPDYPLPDDNGLLIVYAGKH